MVRLNPHRLVIERVTSGNITTDSSHTKEIGFDTNTVVVLAALFCTLVVVLALNWVIHYALKRRRALLDLEHGMAKHTISRKIPMEVFQLRGEVVATECSICLGDFLDGENAKVLPKTIFAALQKATENYTIEVTPDDRASVLQKGWLFVFTGKELLYAFKYEGKQVEHQDDNLATETKKLKRFCFQSHSLPKAEAYGRR
nr:RING-H2 finger protein ATL74 [Tanacetum cinerariifolium]